MNLIGNCCLSNHLLRKYGYGNTNPFTWDYVNFKSFYNLLTQWESIDFSILDVIRNPHPFYKNFNQYSLLIDNKVQIDYVHLLFDPKYSTPTQVNVDIRYCRIWEHMLEQYNKHLDIMKTQNLPPQFVLEWEILDYRHKEFELLLNTELPYKVAIITNNKEYTKISKPNLLILYDKNKKGGAPKACPPIYFCKTYHQQIYNFLTK